MKVSKKIFILLLMIGFVAVLPTLPEDVEVPTPNGPTKAGDLIIGDTIMTFGIMRYTQKSMYGYDKFSKIVLTHEETQVVGITPRVDVGIIRLIFSVTNLSGSGCIPCNPKDAVDFVFCSERTKFYDPFQRRWRNAADFEAGEFVLGLDDKEYKIIGISSFHKRINTVEIKTRHRRNLLIFTNKGDLIPVKD